MNKYLSMGLFLAILAVLIEQQQIHGRLEQFDDVLTDSLAARKIIKKHSMKQLKANLLKNKKRMKEVMKDRENKIDVMKKLLAHVPKEKHYSFPGNRVCFDQDGQVITTTTPELTTTTKNPESVLFNTSYYHIMKTNSLSWLSDEELNLMLGLKFLGIPQGVKSKVEQQIETTTTTTTRNYRENSRQRVLRLLSEEDGRKDGDGKDKCIYFAFQSDSRVGYGHEFDHLIDMSSEDEESSLSTPSRSSRTKKSKTKMTTTTTTTTTSTTTTTTNTMLTDEPATSSMASTTKEFTTTASTTEKPTTTSTTTSTTTAKPTTTTTITTRTTTAKPTTTTATTTAKPTTTTTTKFATTTTTSTTTTKTASIPAELNWVALNKVSAVQDQGLCGSCWAFAATGSIESALAIRYGTSPSDLSEENLVDCSFFNNTEWAKEAPSMTTFGCNGGNPINALGYTSVIGIEEESTYEYVAKIGTTDPSGYVQDCKADLNPKPANDHVYDLFDQTFNFTNNYLNMMSIIAKQPLIAFFEVPMSAPNYGADFFNYKDGIYSTPYCQTCDPLLPDGSLNSTAFVECFTRLSHTVLIVGYGTENGLDYWLCKNSWGTSWGIDGYFKILRGVNLCSIELYAAYSTIEN